MENAARYQIDEEIAQGDFATVYRGRDLQLGRAVAIKQLHEQYLHNPKLTERYWQEAQMLATLEHPHVMTIYDVVPERGWLILELMKGSLKDQLQGQAIGLNDLRLTILFAARALSFFQQQNILHGDVKPSNLLIDRNNWIKLGDFGIARRIQGDDGSAIKGTTRYIAPEVVSDNFGPVGPHSDIYSLGFSAYELLCGERFETLFPGLHMFGRDQQLAWIMWHSAPDRRLPRIRDVLEGVPPELAAVIEKMTNKDPAQRYRSADEVIADLGSTGYSEPHPTQEEQEAAARAARQARRKRGLAIGACIVSMLLSVVMLWPRAKEPPPKPSPEPTSGVVGKVVADGSKIYLKSEESIIVGPDDLILLNGAVCRLGDLKPNDKLEIKYLTGPQGKTKRIRATRGQLNQFSGRIAGVDRSQNVLSLADTGDEERLFLFDGETTVSLNEQPTTLASLKPGDSVIVHFWSDEKGAHAESLDAKRQLTASGVLESVNPETKEVTFQTGDKSVTMALYDNCSIRLNNRTSVNGHVITLADLTTGDRIASLQYDSRVLSIALQRDLSDIVEVWSVDPSGNRMVVLIDGDQVEVSAADASITYRKKPVNLSFLRRGDRLVVAHDSPDHTDMAAKSISVESLASDPRSIALVISQQQYDNIRITPYEFAQADAQLVLDALETGARVPEAQLLLVRDVTRDKLDQAINDFLGTQENRELLVVYFVGEAYVDLNSGITYLAARDFAIDNMKETGLKLRDLIGKLEQFQAREKVLILDTCHKVSASEVQSQPSTEEQIRKVMIGNVVSRSVTVIGSCGVGQRGAVDVQRKHGQFALALADAWTGRADTDGDGHVSGDELFRYLQGPLTRIGQTPVRFQPDTTPRRLKPEAAKAVRRMLADLGRARPSEDFESAYAEAQKLADGQPDAQLAYAVVKLKAGRTGESFDTFLAILSEHPDALVAFHGAAYQRLVKKQWESAADTVARMVDRLAVRRKERSDYILHLLNFAGLAREFIAMAGPSLDTVSAIDAAAKKLDPDEQVQFEAGRQAFNQRYRQLPAPQRGSLRNYYHFDFDQVKQYLIAELDK